MSEIIYSKFSNERNRRFAIRTDILEDNGKRYVKKTALYPEGKEHEKNLLCWYPKLSDMYKEIPYNCNVCEEEEEGVRLEYVTGQTLEEFLDGKIAEGNVQEAETVLKQYLENVQRIYSREEFILTEEFVNVFGQIELKDSLFSAPVTNIDMVCGNLVLAEIPVVLDYEWTFDFPVPVKFVLYRIIHYYVDTHVLRQKINETELYDAFSITSEMRECFAGMERNFQKYITGIHIPMREMFADMSPGIDGSKDVPLKYLQVFFSDGSRYQEKSSVKLEANNGIAQYSIPLPEGCRKIRLDPGETPCAVHVDRLSFGESKINLECAVIPEGCFVGEWIYIAKKDPNIFDIPVPSGEGELNVSLQIYSGKEELIRGMVEQNLRMKENIARQTALINEMEGTKVWKLYKKYRHWVERKKKN